MVTRAAPQATHACQRSFGKSKPSASGGGSTGTDRPCSPLKTPSKVVVIAGTTTATASVAPAR
jgi:hypothetical protein